MKREMSQSFGMKQYTHTEKRQEVSISNNNNNNNNITNNTESTAV